MRIRVKHWAPPSNPGTAHTHAHSHTRHQGPINEQYGGTTIRWSPVSLIPEDNFGRPPLLCLSEVDRHAQQQERGSVCPFAMYVTAIIGVIGVVVRSSGTPYTVYVDPVCRPGESLQIPLVSNVSLALSTPHGSTHDWTIHHQSPGSDHGYVILPRSAKSWRPIKVLGLRPPSHFAKTENACTHATAWILHNKIGFTHGKESDTSCRATYLRAII